MLAFLLALAVPALAQEAAKPAVPAVTQVPGQVSQRTDYLESEVGQLLSGKPTITGVPQFINGISTGGPAGIPMLTTSTDTVSGAKTFIGGVTILGASNLCASGGVLISSQDFVLVSSVSFAVPTSSTDLRINFVLVSTNATHFFVLPNGDLGARYANSNAWQSLANGWGTSSGGSAQHGWIWDNDASCGTSLASFTGFFNGTDLIQTINGLWSHNSQATGYDGGSTVAHFIASGIYGTGAASAAVGRIEILASSTCSNSSPVANTTFSGHIELCAEGYQHK